MKERRQPIRREWEQITSRRPVARRIRPLVEPSRRREESSIASGPESEEERLDRIAGEQLDAHLEDEDMFREQS